MKKNLEYLFFKFRTTLYNCWEVWECKVENGLKHYTKMLLENFNVVGLFLARKRLPSHIVHVHVHETATKLVPLFISYVYYWI